MNRPLALLSLSGFLGLAVTAPVLAQGHDHGAMRKTEVSPFGARGAPPAASYADRTPPLWTNLGTLSYRVTTSRPQAQRYFDQGLRLTYGFNHAEARRSFREAQRLDPACALCFWGEALVLGPNINAPMNPADNAPALAALGQAQAHAARATAKERALIAALEQRYSTDPGAERATLDAAYANAMSQLAAGFPADDDIAVLTAEALMDLSPWDYWEAGGSRPKGRTTEIVGLLEKVLARNPRHPGAIHYYIHAVEASDRPQRAERAAERLAALMPGAGHIVHMPSHIYLRVGRYRDALNANKRAVAADEAFIARTSPTGTYPSGYYPHNIHFLMAAAQMSGDGATAMSAAGKLARTVTPEAVRAIPWAQPIAAAPYFTTVRFGTPDQMLALPLPGDGLPYVSAMRHYARGIAQARRGNVAAARAEAAALSRLEREGDVAALTAAGVPAREVMRLARLIVEARIAQAGGDRATAIARFREAASVQDRLPYTEPPYWYYPVRQSLGAALLLDGRADEAEAEFRASLKQTPNNGWALFGLAEAARARGDRAGAADATRRLRLAWTGDRRLLDVSQL